MTELSIIDLQIRLPLTFKQLINVRKFICYSAKLNILYRWFPYRSGSPLIQMGLAWLQTHPVSPVVSYSSAFITSFPSSSAAELGAIFTAILVAPKFCQISVYTSVGKFQGHFTF